MDRAFKKILIIDDEPDVTRAVRLTITLQEPSWQVVEVHNGEQGLLRVDSESPDLVLLDLMMPDMSGYDVLEQIRAFSRVPVIILTVRDDELDKVRGLELGADDYIVKPFGHLELMARVHSVLRRVEGVTGQLEPPFVSGGLRVDFARHRVTLNGDEIVLTGTEYRLLEILARNAGQIVPTDMLLVRVWDDYARGNTDYLKVYVHRLRRKFKDDPAHPRYLHTARGVGYWLAKIEKQV